MTQAGRLEALDQAAGDEADHALVPVLGADEQHAAASGSCFEHALGARDRLLEHLRLDAPCARG